MTSHFRDVVDRHPGWILFALAMGGFAIGTTEFATMSLLPYMAAGLGIDEPTAGHVISAYALGVVVGAPILAVLSVRLPRKLLLMVFMGMFAVGNALSAMAPSYGWMNLFRFISGLPHGAYFGVAALVAAKLLGPARRAQAVGFVMLGLTVATIVGVPLANWLGQFVGWRWGFGVVALLGLAAMSMVGLMLKFEPAAANASPLRELAGLGHRQVWLTLAIGTIGFGGIFAVYAYLASVLIDVTHMAPASTPIVFSCFGIGMTLGGIIVPRFADKALMPTASIMLLLGAVSLALFPLASHAVWSVTLNVIVIGFSTSLAIILQTRLMDVAHEAQTLAAALNHSAFNMANAIGPWLGGLAIAHGYGFTSTGYIGAGLALGGFAFWVVAMVDSQRQSKREAALAR